MKKNTERKGVENMNFNRTDLELSGFKGFVQISSLKKDRCREVPKNKGIYVVYFESNQGPKFLAKSIGGRHKGQDPTVEISVLKKNWVDGAKALYIGQAGGKGSKATLSSRLKQYMDSGDKNKTSGHWGGRYIWQIAESDNFLIAWRSEEEHDPRDVEDELLTSFYKQYCCLPFANLTR